jgi:5-methyltetrahydropteroyltriglutamate--homocysteine methyltransferase
MRRSDDRILTSHTGSLPRPPHLTHLYAQRARGEPVDEAEIVSEGQAALRSIVPKQIAVGIDVGNNGEQQREGFFLHLRHRLSGLGGSWTRQSQADLDRYPAYKAAFRERLAGKEMVSAFLPPRAIGEVRYVDDALIQEECRDFKIVLDDLDDGFVESFMTSPSPGIVTAAIRNEHYTSEAAYLTAVSAAMRVEYEAIVGHGLLLQIDCPDLALERHVTYRDRPLGDFLGFVERIVDSLNEALSNVPADRVRMHVCWGNYEGPHDCDVPLDDIWPLLRQTKVGGFFLPFANPRHAHEYRIFERLPPTDDQVIIAGVIDVQTNFIEHPEVVADRIERVARSVGDPHRVLAGTDCGFDTSAGAGRVTEDIVWAKLEALRDGARLASDRLFHGE